MGESQRQIFQRFALHPSLSLQLPSIPNQHQATAQMNPRAPPASAYLTLASLPLPRSPRSPRAHSCRPGCRGQASPCHCATSSPQPPSSMPNSLLPPMPPVGRPLAHALPPSMHDLDAESGIAVLRRAHALSSRTARHPARHRSPSNVPTSPSTLALLNLLAVQQKRCSSTEPTLLTVGSVHAWTPRPHH
jgi:hypothetical protein